MGLLNLKDKIKKKLEDVEVKFSEEDVVYLLVEIGKFLERSKKDLDDPNDIKLNMNDFQVIMFFRNWVAHTEKDIGDIPENILQNFEKILSGQTENENVEEALFKLLKDEIEKFNSKIEGGEIKIDWEYFHEKLKCVLVEQSVKVLHEKKYVGYNKDSLELEKIKK